MRPNPRKNLSTSFSLMSRGKRPRNTLGALSLLMISKFLRQLTRTPETTMENVGHGRCYPSKPFCFLLRMPLSVKGDKIAGSLEKKLSSWFEFNELFLARRVKCITECWRKVVDLVEMSDLTPDEVWLWSCKLCKLDFSKSVMKIFDNIVRVSCVMSFDVMNGATVSVDLSLFNTVRYMVFILFAYSSEVFVSVLDIMIKNYYVFNRAHWTALLSISFLSVRVGNRRAWWFNTEDCCVLSRTFIRNSRSTFVQSGSNSFTI